MASEPKRSWSGFTYSIQEAPFYFLPGFVGHLEAAGYKEAMIKFIEDEGCKLVEPPSRRSNTHFSILDSQRHMINLSRTMATVTFTGAEDYYMWFLILYPRFGARGLDWNTPAGDIEPSLKGHAQLASRIVRVLKRNLDSALREGLALVRARPHKVYSDYIELDYDQYATLTPVLNWVDSRPVFSLVGAGGVELHTPKIFVPREQLSGAAVEAAKSKLTHLLVDRITKSPHRRMTRTEIADLGKQFGLDSEDISECFEEAMDRTGRPKAWGLRGRLPKEPK